MSTKHTANKPTDEELLAFAVEEEFLLFCDEHEFLDIARGVLKKFAALAARADSREPAMNAPLTGAEIETLTALVEVGPLWDGDVPSKAGRDSLIDKGYAVRVIVKLEDGYTAATYQGRDAYKKHFGDQDTIREAKAFRQAARALNNVSARSRP